MNERGREERDLREGERERETHKHALPTSSEVSLQENSKPLVELWKVHLRAKIPVEEMANLLTLQSLLEQKSCQGTVMVRLKLEDLKIEDYSYMYKFGKMYKYFYRNIFPS